MVKSLSVPMKMFKVAKLDVYVLNSAIDHLIFLALLRLPYGRASYSEVSTIVRRYKTSYLPLTFKGVWSQNLSTSIRSTVLFCLVFKISKFIKFLQRAGKEQAKVAV